MKFVHILVEGETELDFANGLLSEHLKQYNIELSVSKVDLKPYQQVEKELRRLLRNSSLVAVTTMFDYYGLPRAFPGRDNVKSVTPTQQVQFCEKAFEAKIDNKRFIAYLNLHEFEALLFSSPEEIANEFPADKQLAALQKIRLKVQSSEDINDSPQTAPSKRLQGLFPKYQKDLNGINIARRIGLASIREECQHFNAWIETLEHLTQSN